MAERLQPAEVEISPLLWGPQEDAPEDDDPVWVAFNCCDYNIYNESIEPSLTLELHE